MSDTLQGLNAMHRGRQSPLLHRDIKPDNLLVFPRPGQIPWVSVKLGDLGLARQMTAVVGRFLSRHTRTSTFGTPYFMAPECFSERVSPASDMYAWGVTMAAVVMQAVGEDNEPTAIPREDLVSAAARILNRYHPGIAACLLRCVDPNPDGRPTAREMHKIVQAPPVFDSLSGSRLDLRFPVLAKQVNRRVRSVLGTFLDEVGVSGLRVSRGLTQIVKLLSRSLICGVTSFTFDLVLCILITSV